MSSSDLNPSRDTLSSVAPRAADVLPSNGQANISEIQNTLWRACWSRIAVGLLFVTIAFLAYFPVLGGEFLWDDHSLVQGNRFIRSPLLLGEIFTHNLHVGIANSYYRPVQNVSFLIDYLIWGENSFGFHLSNILLHAVCGWVLYLLLQRILPVLLEESEDLQPKKTRLIALIIALVWTVHPIHNAAVAYISGRADPLSFAFSAAAVCIALASRQWAGTWKSTARLGLAWIFGLVALCTRESAAFWMMLVALYICFFDRGCFRRERINTVAALLLLLGCWLLLRQLPTALPGAPPSHASEAPDRIVLMLRALGDYTRLLVAPVTLTMDRTVWPEWRDAGVTWINLSLHFGWLGCLGLAVLILGVAGACWRSRGQRLRVFGAAWFGLCFLPISNLFPLNAQVAEHWMYLASVGALLFATGLAVTLPEEWLRRVAVMVVVVFFPLMLVRTNLRAHDWSESIRFYSQTIQATGGNPRIINNLAVAYRSKGNEARSEKIFRMGLKQYPSYPGLLGNFGQLLIHQGRTEEAKELIEKALDFSRKKTNLARRAWHAGIATSSIELNEMTPQETLALLKSAREEAPEEWDLMRKYFDALQKVEGPDAAFTALQDFALRQWWYSEPRLLLARYWLSKNEPDKALFELRHAARLDVWDEQPHSEIASIELERKNLAEALKAQQVAVRRAPDSPKQRAALAYILHELGREEEAMTQFRKFKNLEQAAAKTKVMRGQVSAPGDAFHPHSDRVTEGSALKNSERSLRQPGAEG